MIVNFEFLGDEPIENVITCMHFQIDKVVYFGYQETINAHQDFTRDFLREECGVQLVEFHPLSHSNLQSVRKAMETVIDRERADRNQIYFDITGGESLILVAFGMIAEKYKAPLHVYQIEENRLTELNPDCGRLQDHATAREFRLDLKRFVKMRGGVINDHFADQASLLQDGTMMQDVDRIWEVMGRHILSWNPFSAFLGRELTSGDALVISKNAMALLTSLQQEGFEHLDRKKLNGILDDLAEQELLLDLRRENGKYQFRYKNRGVRELLCAGGKILELHMYQQERVVSDDCRIGVHLDWDGVITTVQEGDVLNEIDVLSLRGNIPTFISCKTGRMSPAATLFALYELETVARRFGGKYAKKILVTTRPLGDAYKARAEEMGITLRMPGRQA